MNYRRSQSGVALVITLIMLSVITLIAVAFLALSQRERSSISSTMTATEAEQMANTAADRAKADILAQMTSFITTNINQQGQLTRLALGPDLSVSVAGPYTYTNPPNMGSADYQVLTNLLYDPPPPVFNTNRTGNYEHIGYLDLNRNGRFDPTGYFPVLDSAGNPTGETNFFIGDPQWIGVTARPNEPHSSSNRFIGRYAYLIVPAGRTHDIDYIHNDALQRGNAGFARNQGHGTWELNLAAFLADLNTNQTAQYGWGDYRPDFTGIAFDSAFEMLRYRYRDAPARTAQDFFASAGLPAGTLFSDDGIDQYGDGNTVNGLDNDNPNNPWPGASNPQHFFTIHDFFNPKSPAIGGFQSRLQNANNRLDSYNASTFYRMLAQLGRDSAPERRTYFLTNNAISLKEKGPINLNYVNLKYSPGNEITPDKFQSWSPVEFFEVVADRLLRDHQMVIGNDPTNYLRVSHLPIYPTNYYRPEVHRILQMTLNMFDAISNRLDSGAYPYYPTALRPLFEKKGSGTNAEVSIIGYQQVPQGDWAITNALYWKDVTYQPDRDSLQKDDFVYGAPILIGAKRGFPNFNEYVFQSIAQVHRELNVEKVSGTPAITNHVFYMGISNYMGLEAWNPYSNAYPRELVIVAGVELTTSLTNDEGVVRASTPNPFQVFNAYQIPANAWRAGEFRIPLPIPMQSGGWALEDFLPYSIYQGSGNSKGFMPTNSGAIDRGQYPVPQWVLTTTNRLRFFLFDNGHLIDAVGLAPSIGSLNITKALHDMGDPQNPSLPGGTALLNEFWLTNRVNGSTVRNITRGIQKQLETSQSAQPLWNQSGKWRTSPQWPTAQLAAQGFAQFLAQIRNNSLTNVMRTNMWAPFVPQQKVYQRFVWQANDPLVHYLAEDLRFATNALPQYSSVNNPNFHVTSIGRTNPVYQPWNGQSSQDKEDAGRATAATDPTIKDPRVESANDWDFPTNKFPTIGWLGRVHRGTPWQTVYLKSSVPTPATWATTHRGGRASNPTNDWRLADIFTVAQHPNATRGRMSVNQTNVAAWSALLSGIPLPMDGGGMVVTNLIEPALMDPRLDQLVTAINAHRQQLQGEVFSSLAEFLAVPELTVASPYLAPPGTTFGPQQAPRDRDFEALPEKILSLVKPGEPRFEVYAFGQSLKPAPQSILVDRSFPRLCINYEVTGELAARAVMRVDLVPSNLSAPRPSVRPQAVIESFNILPAD
jgi:hypothetical protein